MLPLTATHILDPAKKDVFIPRYTGLFPFSCLPASTVLSTGSTAAKKKLIPAIEAPYLCLKRPPSENRIIGDFAGRFHHIIKEFDREGANEALGIKGMRLYYFGARYYDAEIGIWTSTDPKNQFWSPYSYAGNGTKTRSTSS